MVKWIVVMKIQPSICLDEWGKPRKKPQSGWSAPAFKPGTSRMRVSCVTTEPPRSVFNILFSMVLSSVYKSIVLLTVSFTVLILRCN